jgi:hypothetical protein
LIEPDAGAGAVHTITLTDQGTLRSDIGCANGLWRRCYVGNHPSTALPLEKTRASASVPCVPSRLDDFI